MPGNTGYDVEIDTDNGSVGNDLDVVPDSPHRIRVDTDNGDITLSSR